MLTEAEQLGTTILLWRHAQAMTLATLATEARLSKGYLSELEHGKKAPSVFAAARIAAALGVRLDLLVANKRPRYIVNTVVQPLPHDHTCIDCKQTWACQKEPCYTTPQAPFVLCDPCIQRSADECAGLEMEHQRRVTP